MLNEMFDIEGSQCLPHMLWICSRYNNNKVSTKVHLNEICQVDFVDDANEIDQAIRKYEPVILCFDFGFHDQGGFNLLRNIKHKYPSLPVLVVTEDNSVEWAIVALRLRVWDYFIKPFATSDLETTIESLIKCSRIRQSRRDNFMLQSLSSDSFQPPGTRPCRLSSKMAVATSYIRQQLHCKLTLEKVARKCGMSKSNFCRGFKSTFGMTFLEYLGQQRIEKALALLKSSDLSVTEISLAIGFQELSNFSTTFQRYVGMRPTGFRKVLMTQQTKVCDIDVITARFPCVNPCPVLCFELNGRVQFTNPARVQLLKDHELNVLENLLPQNHKALLKSCITSGNPITEKYQVTGRTFVWSYQPLLTAGVVFVYGYDVSRYVSNDIDIEKFPMAKPNPVLRSDMYGDLQFINPATEKLIEDYKLKNVIAILPEAHEKLVKACMKSNTPLTEKRILPTQTIVWTYQPITDNKFIYIYGNCIEH